MFRVPRTSPRDDTPKVGWKIARKMLVMWGNQDSTRYTWNSTKSEVEPFTDQGTTALSYP